MPNTQQDQIDKMSNMFELSIGDLNDIKSNDDNGGEGEGDESLNKDIKKDDIDNDIDNDIIDDDNIINDDSDENLSSDDVNINEPKEDPKDVEIRLLKEQLAELKNKAVEKETSPTVEPKTTPTDIPIEEEDFLGAINIEELIEDPKSFNAVLNLIYKKAVTKARSEIINNSENIIKSVPKIVTNNMELMNEMKRLNTKFYTDNPELKPFNKIVAVTFEDVQAANPGKGPEELLTLLGDEVRKRLNLKKNAIQSDPPKLPRKKGSSKRQATPPKTKTLEDELAEMDKLLNG